MSWEFPSPLWKHRFTLLAIYFGLIAIELVWRAWKSGRVTSPWLLATNVGMWLTELGLRAATFGVRLAVFAAVASLVPWRWEASAVALLALYPVVDLVYYWKHRWLHETKLGWALHAPHHSSDELTMIAAIRLGWAQRLVDDFFFLPLLLTGIDPISLFLLVDINESLQFWCHSDTIGRLGWLDRVFNTPANHRVHHARPRSVSNANYASTFVLWDRLFGTWRQDVLPTEFGLETGPAGLNPLRIQLLPLWTWWKARTGATPELTSAEDTRPTASTTAGTSASPAP